MEVETKLNRLGGRRAKLDTDQSQNGKRVRRAFADKEDVHTHRPTMEQVETKKLNHHRRYMELLYFAKDEELQENEPQDKVCIQRRDQKGKCASFVAGFRLLSDRRFEAWIQMLYNSSFLIVMLWFVFIYFVLIVLFAWIILGIAVAYDNRGKECLSGWDYTLEGSDRILKNFEFTFSLSWTTFSTVGYGVVAPDMQGCTGLRWFLAFEAFMGVLFSGFCGALFYSKVSRLNTRAPVTFSNAVCLQYGSEIVGPSLLVGADSDEEEEEGASSSNQGQEEESISALEDYRKETAAREQFYETGFDTACLPYPVLQFRLKNDRLGIPGSELLKASIHCVVVTVHPSDGVLEYFEDHLKSAPSVSALNEPFKRADQELKVFPNFLPFFDTACYVRHVLDENSMLLKPSIRRKIAQLGGWPRNICDWEGIRNCFSSSVHEIVVTIEATSNLTADTVFELKKYKLQDIYVGWRFVGLFHLSEVIDRKLVTHEDQKRLFALERFNEIVPQIGGGDEPIGDRKIEINFLRYLNIDEE